MEIRLQMIAADAAIQTAKELAKYVIASSAGYAVNQNTAATIKSFEGFGAARHIIVNARPINY